MKTILSKIVQFLKELGIKKASLSGKYSFSSYQVFLVSLFDGVFINKQYNLHFFLTFVNNGASSGDGR